MAGIPPLPAVTMLGWDAALAAGGAKIAIAAFM
jgi:hypothetical protein